MIIKLIRPKKKLSLLSFSYKYQLSTHYVNWKLEKRENSPQHTNRTNKQNREKAKERRETECVKKR